MKAFQICYNYKLKSNDPLEVKTLNIWEVLHLNQQLSSWSYACLWVRDRAWKLSRSQKKKKEWNNYEKSEHPILLNWTKHFWKRSKSFCSRLYLLPELIVIDLSSSFCSCPCSPCFELQHATVSSASILPNIASKSISLYLDTTTDHNILCIQITCRREQAMILFFNVRFIFKNTGLAFCSFQWKLNSTCQTSQSCTF